MAVDDRPMAVVLEECLDVVAAVVEGLDATTLTGADARRLAGLLARGERICTAGKLLAARRVAECSAWTGNGSRSPEEWLASLSGTSLGAASSAMETAERMATQPQLEEAVRTGEVSLSQAAEIAQATEAGRSAGPGDPQAERRLIETAKQGASMRTLRHKCRQMANTSPSREDDQAKAERLRRERFFRTWTDAEGAGRGQFKMAPGDYARFMAMFKPFQDGCFAEARQSGRRDSYEAYGADGLVAMAEAATGQPGGAAAVKAKVAATVIALVDLAALRRGAAGEGETCEIVGVGPVPVAVVEDLLSDAVFAAAVIDGSDIRRVVHLGRHATALQRTALWVRDRACVHCGSLHNLEVDHVDDWRGTARTQLDKLAFLCRRCHHLKTYRGWRLVGTPGHYRLIEPATDPDPPAG